MTADQIIDELRARAIFNVELTREEYIERVAQRLAETTNGIRLPLPISAQQLVCAMEEAGISLPREQKFSRPSSS